MRHVFEGVMNDKDVDDDDQAIIFTISDPREERLFIRIQSWDDDRLHPEINALEGKKIRITVEVIE